MKETIATTTTIAMSPKTEAFLESSMKKPKQMKAVGEIHTQANSGFKSSAINIYQLTIYPMNDEIKKRPP